MTNYFDVLGIDADASEWEVVNTYRRKFQNARTDEAKHRLLSGVFIILNDRKKFLAPLIHDRFMRSGQREKYEKLIFKEEEKARQFLSDKQNEWVLNSILWKYPWSIILSQSFMLFLDEIRALSFALMWIIVGVIITANSLVNNTQFFFLGLPLLLVGLVMHRSALRRFRIEALRDLSNEQF